MTRQRELTITEVSRMGGRSRVAGLSSDELTERGRAMADARWARLSTEERSTATEAARAASIKARKRKK